MYFIQLLPPCGKGERNITYVIAVRIRSNPVAYVYLKRDCHTALAITCGGIFIPKVLAPYSKKSYIY